MLAYDFRTASLKYHAHIQRSLTIALAQWAAAGEGAAMDVDATNAKAEQAGADARKGVDADFLAHIVPLADDAQVSVAAGVPCPACGAAIEFSTGTGSVCCANGHDWGEYRAHSARTVRIVCAQLRG